MIGIENEYVNKKITVVCPNGELLDVVSVEELENMLPNPVEGLLNMLVWPNAGALLCPNCPKAEPVCPNAEPVCPNAEPVCPNAEPVGIEGFELNRLAD